MTRPLASLLQEVLATEPAPTAEEALLLLPVLDGCTLCDAPLLFEAAILSGFCGDCATDEVQ